MRTGGCYFVPVCELYVEVTTALHCIHTMYVVHMLLFIEVRVSTTNCVLLILILKKHAIAITAYYYAERCITNYDITRAEDSRRGWCIIRPRSELECISVLNLVSPITCVYEIRADTGLG